MGVGWRAKGYRLERNVLDEQRLEELTQRMD
jgi:hypothetical protein